MIKQLILTLLISIPILSFGQEGKPEIIRGDQNFTMVIKTKDNTTDKVLSGVEVYLYETNSDKLIDTKITENGDAYFNIQPSVEYEIRTCHQEYFKNGMSLYECNEGDEVLCTFGARDYNFVAGGGVDKPNAILKATIALHPIGIGSIFELSNVYYDLDKSFLRKRGKDELDDLVNIMNRNKSIRIELSSHTDSRASSAYNIDLSRRRAQSCYDYLVSKGIDSERIIPKGYGENRLKNNCRDGIQCTEAQHQKNRRTEIEVLNYQPLACSPSMNIDFKNKDLRFDSED
jgi:outer membrane protein OmpA-like peptidoglycan-associated protein